MDHRKKHEMSTRLEQWTQDSVWEYATWDSVTAREDLDNYLGLQIYQWEGTENEDKYS